MLEIKYSYQNEDVNTSPYLRYNYLVPQTGR